MEYESLNLKAKYLKMSNGVPDSICTPFKNSPKYAITEYPYTVFLKPYKNILSSLKETLKISKDELKSYKP